MIELWHISNIYTVRNPARGFQSMKTAYATLRGFEIMRMFKKGQFNVWMYGNRNKVSFINQLFGVYNWDLS